MKVLQMPASPAENPNLVSVESVVPARSKEFSQFVRIQGMPTQKLANLMAYIWITKKSSEDVDQQVCLLGRGFRAGNY